MGRSPFFKHLPEDDQGDLIAARQEEMSHYALEKSVTGKPSPFTTFYYPAKVFSDAQRTLDILVTLEDAFIAAYLVGVRNFRTPALPSGRGSTPPSRTSSSRSRPGSRSRWASSTRSPAEPLPDPVARCRAAAPPARRNQ